MSDETQAIESPEDVLLSAVLGGDGEAPPRRETRLEASDDLDETVDAEARDGSADEAEAEAEETKQAEAEPDEDYIEIAGEDGAEPQRLKLAEVLDGYRAHAAFQGREAEALERIERDYAHAAQQEFTQVREFSMQTAVMLQAAMQMLGEPRAPQPPHPGLRNTNYAQWEDENAAYQQAQFDFAQRKQQFDQARQLGEHLMARAQQASEQAQGERERAEASKLVRVWPELGQPEGQKKFVSDMEREYGFTAQELDEVLTDHRQALVARDALAFRAMKAKSADAKTAVAAKAPKLVRTKQAAKGSAAQARDSKGQFASEARARLAKSHSDEDAAAFFTGLVKAGRI